MPAAAVIPAPRAYIKVVAVKKLVVEPWGGRPGPPLRRALGATSLSSLGPSGARDYYFE